MVILNYKCYGGTLSFLVQTDRAVVGEQGNSFGSTREHIKQIIRELSGGYEGRGICCAQCSLNEKKAK